MLVEISVKKLAVYYFPLCSILEHMDNDSQHKGQLSRNT